MGRIALRYFVQDVDRYGNVRLYFRRRGFRKLRLPDDPASAEFSAAYRAAFDATASGHDPAPATHSPESATRILRPTAGTLRWLISEYKGSAAYRRLSPRTQHVRGRILDVICQEPIAPGHALTFGEMPLGNFTAKMVRIVRVRKADAPDSGNARGKALRQAFTWALEFEHARANPAKEVAYFATGSEGFHTWTIEEMETYRARWPLGTRPRLALEILALLGVRRSDVVILGRQHRRGDVVRFQPTKGRRAKPQILELPILPDLAAAIEAGPTGDLTWIVTESGKPYTPEGFGNIYRRWCDAAGLTHCSAHGVRKAAATIAAENGADPHKLMKIFGWRTLKEAERYTRAVRQAKMAAEAMPLLIPTRPKSGTP